MAFYLFNFSTADGASPRPAREQAMDLLRSGQWDIDHESPHRDALAPGDVALVYAAAPDRVFIGRANIASAVQVLAPAETTADGVDARSGVVLSHVEEWDPPVAMEAVLARMDPSEKTKADFPVDVVRITPGEYETAVAVAAERRT
jgi:hypothetical protein